jgi:hypothetical protein
MRHPVNHRQTEEADAIAIAAPSAVQPGTLRHGAATRRGRTKQIIRQRLHRLPGVLLVLAALLPILIITVFGPR